MDKPSSTSPTTNSESDDASLSALAQEEDTRFEHVASRLIHREMMHSGPLPPPEMLAGYEQVLPGSAERILSMAENQQDHRLFLEKTVISGNIRDQGRGVVFAFLLCLTGIVGGIVISLLGHTLEGFSSLFVSLAALVGVFIVGRRGQHKEREAAEASEEV